MQSKFAMHLSRRCRARTSDVSAPRGAVLPSTFESCAIRCEACPAFSALLQALSLRAETLKSVDAAQWLLPCSVRV
jgi:hypothetical protein